MRALLDTNVLVSTAIKPAGKPAQIYQAAGVRFDLVTCEPVLAELADVLGRAACAGGRAIASKSIMPAIHGRSPFSTYERRFTGLRQTP